MKPRLEAAPLTDWDQGIFSWINQRWLFKHGTCEGAVSFYSRADRRDADLMYYAATRRWLCASSEIPGMRGELVLFASPRHPVWGKRWWLTDRDITYFA